jgi:RNA polymerase sigma-70 factor (ECF subfamily)
VWTLVLNTRQRDTPLYRESLERLISLYWRPVYRWLRWSYGLSDQVAQDLVQDFFAKAIESGLMAVADPERGRFRTFVKAALRNFISDWRQREMAQKRGGGSRTVALEELTDHEAAWEPPSQELTPDALFDLLWRRSLAKQAWQDVRAQLAAADKAHYADIFEKIVLDPPADARPTYEAIACEFASSRVEVMNRLAYVKHLLRLALIRRVRESVSTPEEIEQELRDLALA